MTKEILERAKELDGNVGEINEALDILDRPMLRIYSGLTGDEFKFSKLDNDTLIELKAAMRDVLTKRKSSMIDELERL